jgi:hypothetical protein
VPDGPTLILDELFDLVLVSPNDLVRLKAELAHSVFRELDVPVHDDPSEYVERAFIDRDRIEHIAALDPCVFQRRSGLMDATEEYPKRLAFISRFS